MRLLVTGGSGLLGSKLGGISVNKGYETFSGYYKNQSITGVPVRCNILNKENIMKCFEEIKPDVVVHAAANTNVDDCEENNDFAKKVNVDGTKYITNICELYDAFLIYVSSDYVFSGDRGMYNEYDECDPINYYGLTKYEAEKIVINADVEWCIVRPSVIYDPTSIKKKNFTLWVIIKIMEGKKVKVVTDQCVSPVLNKNLSEMILEIATKKYEGVYHLAGATPINRYDFTVLLADTLQLNKDLIEPVTSSEMEWLAKRPKNTSLDVTKATKKLRNKPLEIREAVKIFQQEAEKVIF